MANLIITGEIAERLSDLAQRENRPVEVILRGLLENYQSSQDNKHTLKDFPVDDLGPWPSELTLRRDEMYGDDGR